MAEMTPAARPVEVSTEEIPAPGAPPIEVPLDPPAATPDAVRVRVHPSTRLDGDQDTTIDATTADRSVRWTDAEHAVVGVGSTAHRALVGRLGPIGRDGRRYREVVVDGWRFVLEVEPERLARLRETASRAQGSAGHGGPSEVRAAIPGRIVAVSVAIGDTVDVGQQLLVIEAMKMQNEVRSPRTGIVVKVAVAAGETVDLGAVLVGIA